LIKVRAPDIERNGRAITLRPGMTSTVEIRTGQKAVIEYLFRPLQSVTQALTER
jgi:adhesin transport system membrane fusion protein